MQGRGRGVERARPVLELPVSKGYSFAALLIGIAIGCFYWDRRIRGCQSECAKANLVCSPLLRERFDYCVTVQP